MKFRCLISRQIITKEKRQLNYSFLWVFFSQSKWILPYKATIRLNYIDFGNKEPTSCTLSGEHIL